MWGPSQKEVLSWGEIALEGMVADGGQAMVASSTGQQPLLGHSLDSSRPAEAQPQQLRGLAKGQRNLRGHCKGSASAQEALLTEHVIK